MAPNGTATRRPLKAGIYAPTMTFFDPSTEDLDLPTIRKHAVFLAKSGLVGLVTMGSNGEAVHLTREEKASVTSATRSALDEAGFDSIPVIAGCSEMSVRGTLLNIADAQAAGAEYALILSPSYYRYAMDNDALYDYFTAVADKSPLPIILYNYPGAVAGIDLDSDLMIKLAGNKNIIGAKFTCGNTGKLSRVAQELGAASVKDQGKGWMAFGGFADFTMQCGASGASGIIAGGANVWPRMCVRVWELWRDGKWEEAIKLNEVLAKADWILTRTAIPGTKAAIEIAYGYGGVPRRPLRPLSAEKRKELEGLVKEYLKTEQSL
ncbi:L-threo-3-deoxy-hexylosonate aldolase [Sphaceloma murrayae]|uniref:L-threo-3-deoxy-hexylosonate aldolase n=1 Tax=Sphaceloma murrayae TaxID=2082308 RepID=A0A2K1QYH1_9PEZI|nr:L-threo-3-deoxy-hexylosonate aldolase [Sphaceloma murrayae]